MQVLPAGAKVAGVDPTDGKAVPRIRGYECRFFEDLNVHGLIRLHFGTDQGALFKNVPK
jgi:hypothetical protein